MPRLAAGATESGRARTLPAGFTLVELLVVMLIAGIVTSLVLLRLPAIGSETPERLLQRLDAELESMCDRALLTGNARGLRFHDRGYDFWQHAAGRWQAAPPPRAREWPVRTVVDLEIEGLRHDARGTAARPQVICTGIEPPTSFRLRLARDDARAELVWPP